MNTSIQLNRFEIGLIAVQVIVLISMLIVFLNWRSSVREWQEGRIEAEQCRESVQRILNLRQMEEVAVFAQDATEISNGQIFDAATKSGLESAQLQGISDWVRDETESEEYQRLSTSISLANVTMPQLIQFIFEIEALSDMARVSSLSIGRGRENGRSIKSVGRSKNAPDRARETWETQLTLTQLYYVAKKQSR